MDQSETSDPCSPHHLTIWAAFTNINTKHNMHNICTISSPVPFLAHNSVQVPWTILTPEATRAVEGKLSSPSPDCATFWNVIYIYTSLFFTCGQTSRKALNTFGQKSLSSFGCQCSVVRSWSELSNEDFNHLCVRAVDAPECLEWCFWLLRGVCSEDKISRLEEQPRCAEAANKPV